MLGLALATSRPARSNEGHRRGGLRPRCAVDAAAPAAPAASVVVAVVAILVAAPLPAQAGAGGRTTAEGPTAGVVLVRAAGKRPSAKDMKRFNNALVQALGDAVGWQARKAKPFRRAAGVDQKWQSWRCSPPDPPAPAEAGAKLDGEALRCALGVAKEADVERLVVGRIRHDDGAYYVELDHLRADLGRVVQRVEQRLRGDKFKKLLEFAPALARRTAEEYGGWRLVSNVTGANIDLDGQYYGETPAEQLDGVAPGTYELEITADGYFEWSGDMVVEPGRIVTVDVQMKQPRTSPMPAPPPLSRARPWVVAGVGGAALLGGAVLAATASGGTRYAGAGVAAAGAATIGYALVFEF